ncbi:MbnP family protein [Flavihumibacter profundi]|jgi:hypothetical protein|uniref:MbnP family protein n=1 Tax=Flavihumibacter profundi TaxID=2716883 RepID=UPI001CC67BBC|nr:MbnP family protein [Flavihumibacter profundi]MBZ5858681.1 hypothetical protein [Flavihumibacter profundi]
MKYFFIAALSAAIIFASCSKTKSPDFQPGDTGELEIEFDNVVGAQNLQLYTGIYTNAAGESFSVDTLNYYISNIRLKNENGTEFIVPVNDSYFLIKEANSTQIINLQDIPAGNYTGLSFIVGIDSLKSTEPAGNRTSVLDPAGAGAGMYWDEDRGYIFMKMEGHADAVNTTAHAYRFNIGGYGGPVVPSLNNIKAISLNGAPGARAEVRKNKAEAPHIHLFSDVLKLVNGATNISFADHPDILYYPFSVNVANNYANMFSIDHIHND